MTAPVRILGRGVICGAGEDVEDVWRAVVAARPGLGIHPNALGDPRLCEPRYVRASPMEDIEATTERASVWLDRVCRAALADAGLSPADLAHQRVVLLGGSSLGGMTIHEAAHRRVWDPAGEAGPGIAAPRLGLRRARYDGPLAHVAAGLGCTGLGVNTACSSTAHALGIARLWLHQLRADLALVAGYDVISPFVYAGFACLNALDPEPCDPFAAGRAGLNLGEAAVAFVLGRGDNQGSAIELRGYGCSCDAHHLTRPDLRGGGLARAVRASLADAGLEPADIDFVSAHGTATPYNDRMEAAAFATVFGAACPPIHCAKPVFGHTLGAAGGMDALVVCEALSRRELPATYRRGDPDPDLPVHPDAEPAALPPGAIALSTSSGFGGNNAALILGAGATR